MEAKDLMVDIFVYFCCFDGSKIAVRITGFKDGIVYGDSERGSHWCNIEKVKPILLIPEILEKNGFKRDPLWHHCDKDLCDYTISVQLGYANKIEYIKIAEKGKDNVIPSERTKMYLTHIKYVHQLQHALRLCGIEKEIIL